MLRCGSGAVKQPFRRPTLRSAILSSAGYNFHTYINYTSIYSIFAKIIQIFFWINNIFNAEVEINQIMKTVNEKYNIIYYFIFFLFNHHDKFYSIFFPNFIKMNIRTDRSSNRLKQI